MAAKRTSPKKSGKPVAAVAAAAVAVEAAPVAKKSSKPHRKAPGAALDVTNSQILEVIDVP